MEGDTSRILITKIKRTEDNRCDLYGRNHRFRDTILFDLSELSTVGIDYVSLPVGVETPCRFWAHVQESDKKNRANNPYLDVVMLEPVEPTGPAQASDLDNDTQDAILSELRAIKAILLQLVPLYLVPRNRIPAAQAPKPQIGGPFLEDEPEEELVEPAGLELLQPAARGESPSPEAPEQAGPEPVAHAEGPEAEPLSDDQARRAFSTLAGPAIRDGKIDSAAVNLLTKEAVAHGWGDQYRKLRAAVGE